MTGISPIELLMYKCHCLAENIFEELKVLFHSNNISVFLFTQDLNFELLKSLNNSPLFIVVCLFEKYVLLNISGATEGKEVASILNKERNILTR